MDQRIAASGKSDMGNPQAFVAGKRATFQPRAGEVIEKGFIRPVAAGINISFDHLHEHCSAGGVVLSPGLEGMQTPAGPDLGFGCGH